MTKENYDRKAQELGEKIESTNPRFKNKIKKMQEEKERMEEKSKRISKEERLVKKIMAKEDQQRDFMEASFAFNSKEYFRKAGQAWEEGEKLRGQFKDMKKEDYKNTSSKVLKERYDRRSSDPKLSREGDIECQAMADVLIERGTFED